MATQYIMQRDTQGWKMQVWLSFGIALTASAAGVIELPGADLDRAFIALGFFFCLFSSFAVAKAIRDNRDGQVDTASWIMAVWIAFAAAIALTAWGLYRMTVPGWQKSYVLVSWLFLISSSFTLAKLVRDQHEVDLIERGDTRTIAAKLD